MLCAGYLVIVQAATWHRLGGTVLPLLLRSLLFVVISVSFHSRLHHTLSNM